MRETTIRFARKPLATAIMCSVLGVAPAAFGATIDNVNTDNLAVPPVEGKTLVYTDTEGTASFGWIEPATDFDTVGLGIAVYNEVSTDGVFDGCIMAQTDQPEVNCNQGPDSGKRYKLKSTETNGPIDLVFNVSADGLTEKSYRVFGKLSNLTDALNAAGGDLNGFSIETGFGVGNGFQASSAADGLALGAPVGPNGKYPGGLFGGSKAEGLPFFSISIAEFVPQVDEEDKMQTTGVTPAPYFELFGDWLALSEVPSGWFIDHDGNPANDSILLAWNAGTADAADWRTFEKVFSDTIQVDTDGDGVVDTLANVWDPNDASFDSTVADNVQPIVATLETVEPAMTLLPAITDNDPATVEGMPAGGIDGLYNGTFKVLIEGQAVTIANFDDWATTPVTIRDNAVDADMLTDASKFVIWNPEALDGEGAYEANPAYTGGYVFSDYDLDGDLALSLTEISTAGFFAAGSTDTLARWPGYVQGAIEDLANVNTNAAINVSDASSWPTCTGDGVDTTCTFTMRVTALNEAAVEVPVIPETPVQPEVPTEPTEPESRLIGNGSGCTVGAPGAPIDPVLPGMVLLALAGLWARKRRADA